MQVLRIKKTVGCQETMVGVKVHRSWQDGSGRCIYLHADGTYGYKDGAPAMSREDFSIIGSPVHRKLAIEWWEAYGKKRSEKFYADRAQKERDSIEDFREDTSGSDADMDAILYRRRSTSGPKKGPWEGPIAWMEYFKKRPDWWGQAESITLPGFEYKMDRNVADETLTGNIPGAEV